MSEKEKQILRYLAEKLPNMTEREKGYLEGTIATAAAMGRKRQEEQLLQTGAGSKEQW